METSGVCVPRAISLAGPVGLTSWCIGEGENEVRGDLLERVLRIREAELLAEQRCFGGIIVGRGQSGDVEVGWVNQALGLLNER